LRYRQFHEEAVPQALRLAHYDEMARRANLGDTPGSSAAGDQPKFTCSVLRTDGQIDPVIVKFSADLATASGRRWGDLLLAEHLALQTLRDHGFQACVSQAFASAMRVYLEVVRFDRRGARGRYPMVSMAGVDGLLGALDQNWTRSTSLLQQQGSLADSDWQQVRVLDLFGALIGNTDRHPGNLSLSWQGNGRFSLAPVYDMLPMMYQPNRQGEIVTRSFELSMLNRLDLQLLGQALPMACEFWQRVQADTQISPDFHEVAARHLTQIMHL
jgi:serine/threonine protein kinase HipA of HipAB toxin-antitoxin module